MKNRTLLDSFKNAINGFVYCLNNEKNFKMHLKIFAISIFFAFFLGFNVTEIAIVLLISTIVIALEMINTSIEKLVDLVVDNKIHPLAKIIKDISAGAVFISAISSLIIAGFLYIPKFLIILKSFK
ncbi:diacylglycerol kinase (ATP) [Natranaerovirga pectinivora]|uniref:Diacylglycerol kinase (ATP) n=1 Tax=Natranaerovirga pectinivora TaxID=682400 RepID=A0A4V6NZV2_9FIRM|nr:diacylglycerol kinase family protein [Natranaerovirga pectinivora]TCT17059.1 diacylglycerol kinase (ATP) [Natranaerovirga pectinivora]